MPGIKKILVTGSTGFIGKNLTEQLQLSYDISSPTSKQLNLLDENQVKKYLLKNKFDIVLHCATHNGT
ncbi:MAG: sugar nucleotide-binding protein, partial [Patescibacteria group bacterium]